MSSEIGEKVAVYLAAGVRVVWIADPVAKTVVVHCPSSQPCIYNESDTLALDEIIPGLRLKLADIFPI
jgi:Uma2 family endonuclease